MFAKILIKGKENSIELMDEMSVTLEKACVTLSMGISNFQFQEMAMKYWFRKSSQILKMIKS